MVWQAALILAAALQASADEKQAANLAYTACLYSAAERLDDGTSDAISIAMLIMPICETELDQVADTLVKGVKRPERVKRYLLENLRTSPDVAGQVVLTLRKNRTAARLPQ